MRATVLLATLMIAFAAVVVAVPTASACVTHDERADVCFSCPGETVVWVAGDPKHLFTCW